MSDDFVSAAMQYGLRCIGKESLVMKPEQLEAVRQVCLGKEVFIWLPMGFGKSLCYELLPQVNITTLIVLNCMLYHLETQGASLMITATIRCDSGFFCSSSLHGSTPTTASGQLKTKL